VRRARVSQGVARPFGILGVTLALACGGAQESPRPEPALTGVESPDTPPVIVRPPTPGPLPCMEYDVVDDLRVFDGAHSPFGARLVDFAADLAHLYVAANAVTGVEAGRVYDLRVSGTHALEELVNVSPHDIAAFAESQDALLVLRGDAREAVITRAEKGRDAASVVPGSLGAIRVAATSRSRFFAFAARDRVMGPSGTLFAFAPELNVLGLATAGERAFLLTARDATNGRVLAAGSDRVPVVLAELDRPGRVFASDGARLYAVELGAPARLVAIDLLGAKVDVARLPDDLGAVVEVTFDSRGVYVVGATATARGDRAVRVARVDKAGDSTRTAPIVKSFLGGASGRLFAADDCNIYFASGGSLHRQSTRTLGR
jgi:hypothetical protein